MEDRCAAAERSFRKEAGWYAKYVRSVSSMKKRAKSLPKKKAGLKKS